jgi:1-deoxy-D-xylulose-5-phosphate synthase
MARYFNALITTPFYNRWNRRLKNWLSRHRLTRPILEVCRSWKRGLKDILFHSSLFEAYGVRYIGPIDGHDLPKLEKYLAFAKTCDGPVLLHVLTQKGRGYQPALDAPSKFHGTGPFDLATGNKTAAGNTLAYQDAFGAKLAELARANPKIVGITAAMAPGTGLNKLREACPNQFFDVGIAEEHAVTFAAGLAAAGMRPVVAIYSTFMQRAFDQAMHDVCLQNLPVVFCMDRAGVSPADGATHHGLFDIAFIRALPNATLMQPRNCAELEAMLAWALGRNSPVFIRYPKGGSLSDDIPPAPLELGKAEVLREGTDVQIWSLGNWDKPAREIAQRLQNETGLSVGIVNARFIKPLDSALLIEQAQSARLIITLEDAQAAGGFGSAVLETLSAAGVQTPVEIFGYPDRFIPHASTLEDCRTSAGLDDGTIYQRILERLKRDILLPIQK